MSSRLLCLLSLLTSILHATSMNYSIDASGSLIPKGYISHNCDPITGHCVEIVNENLDGILEFVVEEEDEDAENILGVGHVHPPSEKKLMPEDRAKNLLGNH